MKTEAPIRGVREVLERYGFQKNAPIDLVKYRENYVFRLTNEPGDSYALRLHRAGHRSDAEINTELAYLHVLAGQGMSVPEPISTLTDELMCTVTAEDGTVFQLDVLRWVEGGRPLGDITEAMSGDASLDQDAFRQLGVLAAELHNRTSVIGRGTGFQRQAWDGEGLVGLTAQWGNPLALQDLGQNQAALLRAAVERLRHDLGALPKLPDRYGVIHADLTPENVLVRNDGQLVMIDFDDFGEGWHLFDLATILFFYQPHPQYENYRQSLLQGYASVRPYPDGFLNPWDAMLLARGMTYLGWAAERRGDEAAEYIVEHVVPLVLRLAENYTSPAFSPAGS